MRAVFFWVVLVIAIELPSSAQRWNNPTKYGFTFSQFTSGSGFQPGFEAHFTLQPSNKAKVGFGIFIDNETKEVTGITITHQRLFMANRYKLPLLQPFLFYNFIYRRTSMPELLEAGAINYNNFVAYTSLEHHIGVGFNINISKNILLESGLGYGLYLGSIKRPSDPDPTTREISGTNGKAFLFKTGLGFRF
jgi:hypothetical protein